MFDNPLKLQPIGNRYNTSISQSLSMPRFKLPSKLSFSSKKEKKSMLLNFPQSTKRKESNASDPNDRNEFKKLISDIHTRRKFGEKKVSLRNLTQMSTNRTTDAYNFKWKISKTKTEDIVNRLIISVFSRNLDNESVGPGSRRESFLFN